MAGIIFIVLSILILILLAFVSRKTRIENKSQQKNQNNNIQNNMDINLISDTSAENNNSLSETNTDSEEDNVVSLENDYANFSLKSYKDDEDYRRMASLVKNIYFSLVAFVFVLLGILYFIFFK